MTTRWKESKGFSPHLHSVPLRKIMKIIHICPYPGKIRAEVK